jgi:dipeptidyl aminopeptidase/acylaminoacyl peptidase
MKKLLLLFLALLATPLFADRLTLDDYFRVVSISDPQFSPDGKSIVCIVSRPNRAEDRHDTELILVDAASGAQQPLTFERRGLASPRWSPQGDRIAFLAMSGDKEPKRQIFIMPMRGGDARRITDAPRGVQQFAWSPDGKTIAYVTADEPKANDDKHNRSFEVSDDDYLTTAAPTPSHVWLIASNGGTPKRLTSGTWSLPVAHPPGPAPSPLSWSPDGKWIAISRLETPHTGNSDTSRVELIDAATGAERRLTQHDLAESHPLFSPDGSQIAYSHPLGGTRLNEEHVWVTTPAGGAGRDVTSDLDRNLYRAIWMPDSKSLLVGGHDETTSAMWIQPLDGPARRLDLGDIEPTTAFWLDAAVSSTSAIAFSASTPSRPRELYILDSPSSKPRRLTDFNASVASRQLGRVETVTWTNEGFSENGVVVYPPDYDASKKYPLVLYIHGGPRSTSTTAFAFLPQLLAAQGWIVFSPNYRGSDNLGNRYEHAITGDAGAGPGRDVIAGIAAVKKRASVDDQRIAVGGWSYGGYMTSWMIGHYPIFKAAVSGAAVNNLIDSYSLSDGNALRRYQYGGSPFVGDYVNIYREQSPITYAKNIKVPVLIMSDTGDYRVPITESYQMYHALKDNGVPVKFIAYPVTGHSPEDPVHAADILRRYVEWFSTYLR